MLGIGANPEDMKLSIVSKRLKHGVFRLNSTIGHSSQWTIPSEVWRVVKIWQSTTCREDDLQTVRKHIIQHWKVDPVQQPEQTSSTSTTQTADMTHPRPSVTTRLPAIYIQTLRQINEAALVVGLTTNIDMTSSQSLQTVPPPAEELEHPSTAPAALAQVAAQQIQHPGPTGHQTLQTARPTVLRRRSRSPPRSDSRSLPLSESLVQHPATPTPYTGMFKTPHHLHARAARETYQLLATDPLSHISQRHLISQYHLYI